MQSMENAGVIVYQACRLPKLLSAFSPPRLELKIDMKLCEEEHAIFILICPVNSDKLDRKRYRLLKELVDKNHIKFLVERFEAKAESNVSKRKNEIHYTDIMTEIQAIKQLAVLLKKSQDCGKNLLKSNVGFIMGEPDIVKIDLLSEEAESVMLYEAPAMTEQLKWKLHNELMEKKGVSIVFTRDIEKIIQSSDILSIDEKIDLSLYAAELQHKIILGKSMDESIKAIYNVTLWFNDLKQEAARDLLVELNDEILSTIRYFNIKLDIIDFIKKLPYIYL